MNRCRRCDCWIDVRLGADPIGAHQDRDGSREYPRSPGDYDDICDVCCYDRDTETSFDEDAAALDRYTMKSAGW
jgi:hypothetical protein